MIADPARRVAADARRRVLSVVGFAVGGLGFTLAYHQLGVGVPCPMLALTGWWCPFCGATRMASAVLDGDLAGAFHWNPAVFITLLMLGGVTIAWIVEWVTGRTPPWRAAVRRRSFGTWFTLAVVLTLGWMLARNVARILAG